MSEQKTAYLTGAVTFKDGFVDELVIYPLGPPDPELEAVGHMQEDYLEDASRVISDIKEGHMFGASFHGAPKLYPLEIVMRDGRETLEIADIGQPAEFKTLRNLPLPGGK